MLVSSFPDYSSMLMIGSPGIGVLEFSAGIVKEWLTNNELVVFVAVDQPPSDVLGAIGSFGVDLEAAKKNLYVIDYHSSLLGSLETATTYGGVEIRKVADLESIMFNITNLASSAGRPIKIIIHSLSTLFLYNQANVVLKFFQISSSRFRTGIGSAIFTVHDGVHDEKTINHLMAIADGVMELQFDEDLNRRMRIRNMRGFITSSHWIPFEIRGRSEAEKRA